MTMVRDLITHFFLSVILVEFCVTLFLLISSSNFRLCLFFVQSKDFLWTCFFSDCSKLKNPMLLNVSDIEVFMIKQ